MSLDEASKQFTLARAVRSDPESCAAHLAAAWAATDEVEAQAAEREEEGLRLRAVRLSILTFALDTWEPRSLAASLRARKTWSTIDQVVMSSFAWYMEENAGTGYSFSDPRIEARRDSVFELMGVAEELEEARQ